MSLYYRLRYYYSLATIDVMMVVQDAKAAGEQKEINVEIEEERDRR